MSLQFPRRCLSSPALPMPALLSATGVGEYVVLSRSALAAGDRCDTVAMANAAAVTACRSLCSDVCCEAAGASCAHRRMLWLRRPTNSEVLVAKAVPPVVDDVGDYAAISAAISRVRSHVRF